MIGEFQCEYRWLSNFWPATVRYEGMIFPSVENAYQASKCAYMDDMEQFTSISATQAKSLGRRVRILPDFDQRKVAIMRQLVHDKFLLHPELEEKLLATGNQELVEGNTWGDRFWGKCGGEGRNELGKILMAEREWFRTHSEREEIW